MREQLLAQLPQLDPCQIVLESTVVYNVELVDFLIEHGYALAVALPARIQDFARGLGWLAKTNAIDARTLVRYSQLGNDLTCREKLEEHQRELHTLVARRQQLVNWPPQENNHLEAARRPSMRRDIQKVIDLLDQHIESIDGQIAELCQADEESWRLRELLLSVPGFRPVTTVPLIAELPDLGQINCEQIAELVGVTPIKADSGAISKRRSIRGERTSVRCAFYMAAFSAVRHKPVVREFAKRLEEQGTPFKVRLTAFMRKLLSIIKAIVKSNLLCRLT